MPDAITSAELHKAWEEYLRQSKREAEEIRLERKKAARITSLIQSRRVTIYNPKGKRLRNALWGKWVTWNEFVDNTLNLRAAIREAIQTLKQKHIGSVVYVRQVRNGLPSKTVYPVFECKWGTDGEPFIQWKPNPVADRVRRRVAIRA